MEARDSDSKSLAGSGPIRSSTGSRMTTVESNSVDPSAVVLVFLPKIQEVRRVRPVSFSGVIFRVTRVNALAGLVFDIVGARPKPPADGSKRESD